MPTTDTTEKGLEALIENSLLTKAGYIKGASSNYDAQFCLDKALLLQFLNQTQPAQIARLQTRYTDRFEEKLFGRLFKQIRDRGVVDVLRNGFKEGEESLSVYYKLPPSQLNPQSTQNYSQNIFSITRQVHFSQSNTRLSLDMVIFINGLPIITFELKNNLTKQNVQDAIYQYQTTRDPREPLFGLGRCLVHFAVDDQLVYMTTQLQGEDTIFLPFNRGTKSQEDLFAPDSAGNPLNPDGIMTDYLWKEVLTKVSLSNILERYAFLIEEKEGKSKKRHQIFPRYHQLDLVRKLLQDAKIKGVGQRYLVQHSAGSGKSNSIAWLSHQLVDLTDTSGTKPVFDSVIVITDRNILDRQIRNNIRQFITVKEVVEAITAGSGQLKQALEKGKKIIITTVQKFPYIVDEIQSLGNKRFAVIIDEAHSSQGGETSAKMSAALNKLASENTDAEEDFEEKVLKVIEKQKLSPNASYFAFTATPRSRTLEYFGNLNPSDGKFYPFHNYSMKQAIEEEFILDVLENYTTYRTYAKLVQSIEFNPKFDTKKGKKILRQFVKNSTAAIRDKTEMMIDHFIEQVLGQSKINGQAKAMVVTDGIVSAVRYKLAFDAYLAEIDSPYKVIVAFSGSKEVDGKVEDEDSMNGFPGNKIEEEFKKDEYRFLIVADKFQTGFDQPLLHTMYVDKTLSDIKAVQTLSRLNRAFKPYKTDTFILDFVNTVDVIKQAFEPFYKTTILSEETDVNQLNDLQDALDKFQIYTQKQVRDLAQLFLSGAGRERLDPILDECRKSFVKDLDNEQQIDFKKKAKAFTDMYKLLMQFRPFRNFYWECLKVFLKLLGGKLPNLSQQDFTRGILESVQVHSLRIERQTTNAIQLEGKGEIMPVAVTSTSVQYQPKMDSLDNIVQDFNDRFGNIQWTDKDRVRKFLFEDLPAEITQDEDYQNAKENVDKQNAKITFMSIMEEKFQDFIIEQSEAYRKFTEDAEFKTWLINELFERDYDKDAA